MNHNCFMEKYKIIIKNDVGEVKKKFIIYYFKIIQYAFLF